jgi:hypothetical protein
MGFDQSFSCLSFYPVEATEDHNPNQRLFSVVGYLTDSIAYDNIMLTKLRQDSRSTIRLDQTKHRWQHNYQRNLAFQV